MENNVKCRLMHRFKHRIFKHFGWVVIGVVVLGLAVIVVVNKWFESDWQFRWAIIGSCVSAIYLLQCYRLHEMGLFSGLFRDFNTRYDTLNEDLNRIISETEKCRVLNKDDRDILYNYFNLCGEEYLYYAEGYILPDVWKVWHEGMKYFFSDERINSLWKEEKKPNSYYGFEKFDFEEGSRRHPKDGPVTNRSYCQDGMGPSTNEVEIDLVSSDIS